MQAEALSPHVCMMPCLGAFNAPEKGAITCFFSAEKMVNFLRPGVQGCCTIRSNCPQKAL